MVVAVTLMSVVFFAFCILRVALRTGVEGPWLSLSP